jgi:non-homologous end joining protein Ku
VKRKAAGQPIELEEPSERPSNVIDLMAALRQSVQGSRRSATPRSSSSRKKAARAKSRKPAAAKRRTRRAA